MATCICKEHHLKFERALKLSKLAPRSEDTYMERVDTLSMYFNRCLCDLSDDDILNYFFTCMQTKKHAAGTLRPAKAGVKFFFTFVLNRSTEFLKVVNPETIAKIPEIFSEAEAWRILDNTRLPQHRACMTLMYTCGLRISEALNMTVDDFDRRHQQIRIRSGKGQKQRMVPIPTWTLQQLRNYWCIHRNPKWIFPAIHSNPKVASITTKSMSANAIRDPLKAIVAELDINITDARPHTFRHSYATHLLDAGVNLHTVSRYLGHSNIRSTMIYLHLTRQGHEQALAIIERIMRGEG